MLIKPDVFCGLDQAAASGWGIIANAKLHAHGCTKNAADIVRVVDQLEALCGGNWARVLVALEDHGTHLYNKGKKFQRSPDSLLGMGEARGWWVHELARRGHADPLRMLVSPGDWRIRVLGMGNSAGTDRLKAEAVKWANSLAHRPLKLSDNDEAEAICLAYFASIDGYAMNEQRKLQRRVQYRERQQRKRQLELSATRSA